MIKIVSFYTDDYRREADGLARSLERFRLDHVIVRVPSRGTWEQNCHQKPPFIERMLREYPGQDIVFLDADSVVLDRPELLLMPNPPFDFAAYRSRPDFIWGGTLFFRNNEAGRLLVRIWRIEASENPRVKETAILSRIVLSRPDVRLFDLPVEYCWVERYARRLYPNARPVIEQFMVGHPWGVSRW